MSEKDENFFSEWRERQIEPAHSLDVTESRLMQDLEHTYQNYVSANRESLQHVQERLSAHLKSEQRDAENMFLELEPRKDAGKKHSMEKSSAVPKTRWGRLSRALNMVAAVLVVALLVGSMLFVLNERRNEQSYTSGTLQPNGSSPGIYMLTQKDRYTSAVSKANIQTRQVLWTYAEPNVMETSSLTIAGTTVYYSAATIPANHVFVYALNTENGTLRWKTDLGTDDIITNVRLHSSPNFLTQPFYSSGKLYVMSGNGKVIALDANSGRTNWTYDSKAFAQAGLLYAEGQLWADQGTVYGAQHDKLFALDASSGKEIWKPVQIAQGQVFSGVHVVGKVLYASSFSENRYKSPTDQKSYIYAFDAVQGKQLWSYYSPTYITHMPTFAGGSIYFVGHGGQLSGVGLYALNAQGKEIWHKNLSKTGGLSDPIVANGLLYVSYSIYGPGFGTLLSASLLALHTENGSEAWNRQVIDDPIQVESGILYTSPRPRQMTAYDAKSGKDLWHTQYQVDISAGFNPKNGELSDFVIVS